MVYQNVRRSLLAIVTDSLYRAAFKSLIAESYLIIGGGLLVDVGETLVVITSKEIGSSLAAQVAVDAVAVDIELAGNILFSFFVDIGHFVYGVVNP